MAHQQQKLHNVQYISQHLRTIDQHIPISISQYLLRNRAARIITIFTKYCVSRPNLEKLWYYDGVNYVFRFKMRPSFRGFTRPQQIDSEGRSIDRPPAWRNYHTPFFETAQTGRLQLCMPDKMSNQPSTLGDILRMCQTHLSTIEYAQEAVRTRLCARRTRKVKYTCGFNSLG